MEIADAFKAAVTDKLFFNWSISQWGNLPPQSFESVDRVYKLWLNCKRFKWFFKSDKAFREKLAEKIGVPMNKFQGLSISKEHKHVILDLTDAETWCQIGAENGFTLTFDKEQLDFQATHLRGISGLKFESSATMPYR